MTRTTRGRGVRATRALGALLLAGALLGGCATLRSGAAPDGASAALERAHAIMLDDLARALEQVHAPRATTVQVTLDADPMTDAFVERLASAGYGVRRVDADQGDRHVALAVVDEAAGAAGAALEPAPAAASRTRLALDVGATRLERSYAVSGDAVRPASPLALGGTRATVRLDDERFGTPLDAAVSEVVRLGRMPSAERLPLISLITDEVVVGVARRASGGPSAAAVNSQRIEVSNLYYGEADGFGSPRGTREPVARAVVVFGNDSLRLGSDGKRQIARFVEDYREGDDLIGLIGCSNGYTALEIGNEGLALGRSRRVAEELVALGIARERIVDEGCWAPTSAKGRFPSRGVVLEILRAPS